MGQRPGCPKYGGRKAGTPNKKTMERQRLMEQAVARLELTSDQIQALSPMGLVCMAMQAEAVAGRWDGAAELAILALPYCHKKLPPPTGNGWGGWRPGAGRKPKAESAMGAPAPWGPTRKRLCADE